MEQITGMAWVTGYEGGPPIIPGGVVDPMVGAHAALALVAALEHRDRTGEGQLVEVPLVEVATAVTAEQVIRYAIDGDAARPARRRAACTACAATTRGSRSIAARDPMTPDERAAWCATRTAAEAAAASCARRASPPRRWCPRTRRSTTRSCGARGFFEPIDHPVVGAHDYPTWPMRMSAGPARYWTGPAPTLGQHTDDVLRDELRRDRRRARAPRGPST